MIFRQIDASEDWTFGKGVNNYAQQNEAIGLNIKTRILSWLNDCFFDMTAGVDWLNRLGKLGQQNLLEQDLQRIIAQTEDVTGINNISINVVGRNFRAEYDVETVYSQSFQDKIDTGV